MERCGCTVRLVNISVMQMLMVRLFLQDSDQNGFYSKCEAALVIGDLWIPLVI